MTSPRKIPRKCIFFAVMGITITLLLLPAEIFEYHGYLSKMIPKDSAYVPAVFNWSLGIVNRVNGKHVEIPEETKEQMGEKSDGIKKVIVLAYMRSGSSLTGKLLEQSDNSIYFFEPLRTLEWSYSKRLPLVDFNNKTRTGGSQEEDGDTRIKIVDDVLSCHFRSTYMNVFFDRSRSSDDRLLPFHRCVGKDLYKVDGCLHLFQDLCDRSLVRIVKVIRMDTVDISGLLEKIPDLKVIHLLRDPRAIVNSFQQMRQRFDIKIKSRAICNYMKANVVHFEKIFKSHPKQTTTLFYESLAEDPIGIMKKLYDFIGVKTTDKVADWVKKNMLGDKLDTGTYSVKNRNSQAVSNKWRNQLKFEDILTIDSACEDFYGVSGYFKVMDRKDLKDSKVQFHRDSKSVVSNLKHRNGK